MLRTFKIYEIPHTDDGGGYDLGRAECVLTLYSPDTSATQNAAMRSTAFVYAGTYLDTNGGLVAVADTPEHEKAEITFFHFHGCTGEVAMFTDKKKLSKHLKDKCRGMTLQGKLKTED